MSEITSKLEFVSVGCNRVAGCSDWAINSGLFAYAGSNFVALYDPVKENRVMSTLKGHTKRVNTVRFIPSLQSAEANETEIVSGSVDSKVIIWDISSLPAKITQTLSTQKDSITSVAVAVNRKLNITYLAATSADGTVCVYKREGNTAAQFELLDTMNFKSKMMEAVSLFFLPESDIPVVVTAGLDHKIHVHIMGSNQKFSRVCSLQGHQDWIRALSACVCDDGSVLMASASQDTKIRLWKFSKTNSASNTSTNIIEEQLKMLKLQESEEEEATNSVSLSTSGHLIQVGENKWTVMLDAVLAGHSDWVHSVFWQPPKNGKQPLKLLTSSMDRTMMIWAPEKNTNIWINEVTMGQYGGLSGMFGQLGYFGACFNKSGDAVIATGFSGSFHYWLFDEKNQDWTPQVPLSGHYGPVMDCSWDTKGNYFVSVSTDQTTRLYGQWQKTGTWHEIARPQIHGYDMNCMAFIQNAEHKIITGADEKVLRAFEAPQNFVDSLYNITGVKSSEVKQRAASASVPALGLSNKAIEEGGHDITIKDEFEVGGEDDSSVATPFKPITLEMPPFEEHLLQNTLWPEIHKLYGHANEIITVACNHSGTVIASACVAKQANVAAIRLWDAVTFKEIDVVPGHESSVAFISFSPDDKYMISVSKDRNMILYAQQPIQLPEEGKMGITYKPVLSQIAHKRIIWSIDWSFDGKFIATGSRDDTVKIWKSEVAEIKKQTLKGVVVKKELPCVFTATFKEQPVTVVQFVPQVPSSFTPEQLKQVPSNVQYWLAVGFENGDIKLLAPEDNNNSSFKEVHTINTANSHSEFVRRLKFRWQVGQDQKPFLQLLSCSEDFSVRLFNIYL